MKTIRFVLAALIVAVLCFMTLTSADAAPLPNQEQAEQAASAPPENATVDGALCQIVYQVDRDPTALGYRYLFYGNGFFVNKDGYVLTAAHVLTELNGGQPYLLLRTKGGPPRFVQADVVTIDQDHDIAILLATPNPFDGKYDVSFLPLATASPLPGQTVTVAALRPIRPRNSYTGEPIIEDRAPGTVLDFEFSQLEAAQSETELFVFSHSVQPGQSGAAVLSPGSRAVAGLVEGEWMRGALTALAAAKHGPASDDSESEFDSSSDSNASPIPGAVIPIHYAISLLQQKGIQWEMAPEEASGTDLAASASEGASEPIPLSLVPAPFPSQSFFGGEVLLDALVDRTGAVSDVRVVHGEDPFLGEALAAVQTWVFRPAKLGGQPADKRIAIAFEFPQPYVPPRSATVHHYGDESPMTPDDSAPLPLSTIEPAYPADANSKGGSVILYGTVDATGEIRSVQAAHGSELFTQAAAASVRGWHFAPAQKQGTAVASEAVIVVTFRQPLVISRTR